MACPICKNTTGFVFGTCVECHYNYFDKTFHRIEVDVDILQNYLPPQIYNQLVEQHERRFKRKAQS